MSSVIVEPHNYKVGDKIIFIEEWLKKSPGQYTSEHIDAAKRQAILTIRKIHASSNLSDPGRDLVYVTNDKGKDITAYLLAKEIKRALGDWDV